jgi:hypothetical protein
MSLEKYKSEIKVMENMHKDGSQHGESGVINEIFRRLKITSGWVCELGAWDGIMDSNTIHLVRSGKFKAVYIEPDNNKFKGLLKTAKKYKNIIPVHNRAHQNKDSINSLDNLLLLTPTPYEFDLVSIDVDSFDYQIWESMEKFSARVVIIEINDKMRGEYIFDAIKFRSLRDSGGNYLAYRGSSFISMLKLGQKKGYIYIGSLRGNMFFVKERFANKFKDLIPSKYQLNKIIEEYK